MVDIEKQVLEGDQTVDSGSLQKPEGTVVEEFKPLAKFERFMAHINAEVRGIERVPEEEKTDPSLWTAASMWMGGNMVCATFALGALGVATFGLSFWDSVLTIIFFNALGALPVSIFSTFGPPFGLRQMVLSRYWFGHQGVRLIAFLNCIACIGWNAVNTMVSAQMLHTVNNGGLPAWGGVLVISVITVAVSCFGYRIVHLFEMWAWVPVFIIFIIVAVRMGMSGAFTAEPMGSGETEAAAVLSFGSAVYGFATGWTSYASDYTVYMRKDMSRRYVFLVVWLGLLFPCNFAMILGAACMTGAQTTPHFAHNYEKDSVGGLFFAVLVDKSLHGFGQFCVVVLALSTVANNIPNLYSLGLSAQTVWTGFRKIPRVVWTIFGAGVGIAIAIPAYLHFANFMHNFMNIIAYWLAIYASIGFNEHIFYRRGSSGYDPSRYEDKSYLPVGYAALFGFACGVAGVAVGMAQIYWVGPLAAMIGDPAIGGDIGLELGFAFSTIGFHATRWLELKYIGK
ncbi:hypothetical protein TRICI_006697 [Trichomonascus ciferrii]|uniref:Purine-cytosine permease n=1 Tax=Trichomonascus ciferrii TaxID=44093 RepID=A0A642UEJ8_9ASCO|nr:hypothetical protein TRICI_006697 [Trichomonascus ciferrii]